MNRVDLKRRLLGNSAFPRIPWIVRELLVRPMPGHDFAHPVLDLAASNESLATALRAEAGSDPHAPLDAALVARLDTASIRRAALCAWAATAARVKVNRLDHVAYWKTALRTAALAEAIAAGIESSETHLAFAAGLLCNLGRPTLDLALEDGYQHRIEGPAADGLPLLDSEQQTYGADHTQAGKWLAEHWRLPFPVVNAIWLHHLSTNALDELEAPHELTEIVALAAMLALMQPTGQPTAPVVARAERLGLTPEALTELHQTVATPRLARDSETHPVASTGGPVADTQLRQRIAYWKSLSGILQAVRPPLTLDDALLHIAHGVQQAFGLAPGVAYVLDGNGQAFACRWRDAQRTAEPLSLDPKNADNPLSGLIAQLTTTRPGEANTDPGLVCAPFLADGEVVGQLVFEANTLGPLDRERRLTAVQRFASACGNALQRCIDYDRMTTEQENMAAAMQRLEHAHRQSLRNARFDSAATLASGAAHQLNNPLAIVSGRAQLLLNRTEDSEQTRGLETILRESRRAARILSELMQFARPGEPKFVDADAAALLRRTAAGLRDEFQARDIQIVEDMAAPLPRVPVDGAQLEIVFSHILRNAAESMRDGGKLTIRARPSTDARALVLQVEDTGPGIYPEAIDHIFEPFFTASGDPEPHTGLGLAVCRAIIDRHLGAITLHNNPNRGCTCTVTLTSTEWHTLHDDDEDGAAPATAPVPHPLSAISQRIMREPIPDAEETAVVAPVVQEVEPPSEEILETITDEVAIVAEPPEARVEAPLVPTPKPPKKIEAKPGRKILFADRDEDLREVLAEALRSRGYEVETAPDGLEAHAAILTGNFDLLIAELNLPALSGRDLLDQSRIRFPQLAVIVLAGAAAPDEDLESIRDAGADLCLRKPFGLETLLREMDRLLNATGLAQGA